MSQQKRDAVRDAILQRIKIGKPIDAFLQQLSERAPSTLIDISFGPKAIGGEVITRALLPLLEQLEERIRNFQIPLAKFYIRLINLAEGAALELLEAVISRHPHATWLVEVSRKAEGSLMGSLHLTMLNNDPQFGRFCQLYADSNARRGLVQIAEELGRVEPMVALLRKEAIEVAIEAGVRALETNPNCGAIEHIAATIGPDIEPLVSRLVSRLQNDEVANHIQPLVQWYPRAALQLQKIR